MTSPNILNNVVIFTLDGIHLTTGKKTMTPTEYRGINKNSITLPPEKIASLGTKQILDPEKINALRKYRTRADAVCSKYGVPFLNGYAVPAALANEVRNRLDDIEADFYNFKDDFIRTVATDFLNWLDIKDEDDDEESKIVKKLFADECVDVPRLVKKLQFGYSSFTVSPYGEGEVEEKTKHLKEAVLDDVCAKAKSVIDRPNFNTRNISQSTVNVLRDMQKKLYSLATISRKVRCLSEYLNNFINSLPLSGILNDNDSFSVSATLVSLSDIDTLNNLIAATDSQNPSVKDASRKTEAPEDVNLVDLTTDVSDKVLPEQLSNKPNECNDESLSEHNSESDFIFVSDVVENVETSKPTVSEITKDITGTQDAIPPADPEQPESTELSEEEQALAAQYF